MNADVLRNRYRVLMVVGMVRGDDSFVRVHRLRLHRHHIALTYLRWRLTLTFGR